MNSSSTPNKQVGFRQVGQQIRFEMLGKIERAIITSYSNNFNGSITFKTNKGKVEDSQVTEYL